VQKCRHTLLAAARGERRQERSRNERDHLDFARSPGVAERRSPLILSNHHESPVVSSLLLSLVPLTDQLTSAHPANPSTTLAADRILIERMPVAAPCERHRSS